MQPPPEPRLVARDGLVARCELLLELGHLHGAASLAPEPPCAEDEDVVELGEVTRAQRDAEGIASAIELDGDESPRSMSRMTQRRRR